MILNYFCLKMFAGFIIVSVLALVSFFVWKFYFNQVHSIPITQGVHSENCFEQEEKLAQCCQIPDKLVSGKEDDYDLLDRCESELNKTEITTSDEIVRIIRAHGCF